MRPLSVRLASADDSDAIARLINSAKADTLVSEVDVQDRAERIRSLIEAGQNIQFIAEGGGEVVGEIALALGHPAPASLGLSVRPDWRRRGVASALIEEAVTWAQSHDVHKLSVEVFPENDAALSLLGKHGFEEEGRLKGHFQRIAGKPRDAISLGRRLA